MKVDSCPDPPAPLPRALLFMMQLTHCSFFKARTMLSWQHHLSSKLSVPFSIYGAVADVPVMSWVEGGALYHHRCCFLNSAPVTSGHSLKLKGQNVLELEKRKRKKLVGSKGTGFLTRCCLRDQRSQVFNATFHPAPLVCRDISEGFSKYLYLFYIKRYKQYLLISRC